MTRARHRSSLLSSPLFAATLLACGPQTGGNDETASDVSTASTGSTDPTTTDPTAATSSESTSDTPTTTPDTDASTGAPACTHPPLSEAQLSELAFGASGNDFQAMPGALMNIELGLLECCTYLVPVDVCAEYTVSPAEGALYDVETGTFAVDASVPAGTVFTLTADVEAGRATVTATVTVYTEESHPLVGTYTEIAQLPCGGGPEAPASPSIGELVFRANGDFTVTWEPFETYVDYWGTYTHDPDAGTVSLAVEGGNYVPPDVDGEGSFSFEGDQLVLHDLWLGAAQDSMGTPACGHRFE